MADFRDFLLQFVREKALSPETTFIEDDLLTWFQTKYPDRKASNIHHQLLKKTTNYPGRVSYLPPPNASDDLFFATDAEFKTYRLYRIDEDPAPYYLDRKQSGRDLVKEPISTSQNALSSSVQANAIYCADCFTLLERVAGEQVTLVYLDPPFFSEDKTFPGRSEFDRLDEYIGFIKAVVNHAKRVLNSSGSLFFHSLPRTAGSVRPILDEVFGRNNFVNEIILPRKFRHTVSRNRLGTAHDSIFCYGKTRSFIYHPQYRYSPKQNIPSPLVGKDEHGHFLHGDLTSKEFHASKQFTWRGFSPSEGRSWRFSEERLDQLVADDRIIFPPGGKFPLYKVYANEREEIGTVWDDIRSDNDTSGKYVYPTQEPVQLMQRIIKMSTDPGALVLDPFCGSGTTLVAAERLERKWIGGDVKEKAYSLSILRLEKTCSLKAGIDFSLGDEALLERNFSTQVTAASSVAVQVDRNTRESVHENDEFSEAFRFAIENKFPYPIAKAIYQLRGIYELSAQVNQLANILGVTLEYLALIVLAEYLAGDERDSNLSERLANTVRQPVSHGAWAGLIRDLLTFFASRGESRFLGELHETYFAESNDTAQPTLKLLSDDLVRTRNDIIKRSVDQLPTVDTIRNFKRQIIRFLQAVSFLTDYHLISVESSQTQGDIKTHVCNLHMGFHDSFSQAKLQCDLEIERRSVAILDLRTHRLLYLYPLFALNVCPVSGCGNRHWFRFDKSDGRRVEYVATNGHKLRDEAAGVDLANLLKGPWGSRKILSAHYMMLDSEGSHHQLSEGQLVDTRYKVIEHLRRGGMADLYKVLDLTHERILALKLLPFQLISDRSVVQRFRQEALQASQFNHPNITRVLGYGESLVHHYLIMELANGWKQQNRKVALDAGELPKSLDFTTCVSIIRQVCDGLDYIHARKVIHRDIKPSNILLFDDDMVKVSDFGIARTSEAITLTLTGLTMGTPEYSSPEQIEGKRDLTFASDIYSLGVVMFELLTGTSPFKRTTPMASAFAQVKDAVPNPKSMNGNIPTQLSSIVVKCLQKDPAKRYSTARELALALDEYTALAERKTKKPRGKIKEEVFYASLANKDARVASELRAFLDDAKSRGLSIDRGDNSLILKFKTHNRIELNFGIFKTNGSFLNRRIAALTERIGYPEIGETYLTVLASLIPGGYVQKSDNKWVWTVRKTGNKPVTIVDCLTVMNDWLVLIEETINQLNNAGKQKAGLQTSEKSPIRHPYTECYANYSSDREPPSRVWADAVQYEFFSGGGSRKNRAALQSLNAGDRLWVNVTPFGFVGVGLVIDAAKPANDFKVKLADGSELPVLQLQMRGDYRRQWAHDPELCEYFVPMKWVDTLPVQRAFREKGLYGTPHTLVRPTSELWLRTLETLKLVFPRHDQYDE